MHCRLRMRNALGICWTQSVELTQVFPSLDYLIACKNALQIMFCLDRFSFLHILSLVTREISAPPSPGPTLRKLKTAMKSPLSLLQTEQTKGPQSFLINLGLEAFHHLGCLHLDAL